MSTGKHRASPKIAAALVTASRQLAQRAGALQFGGDISYVYNPLVYARSFVRDWMGIDGEVQRPESEHPKRPVLGLGCPRSEVSGARLWGWARERFGSPRAFFAQFFVWNYCPLSFMLESGANYTPNKLPTAERTPLYNVCDEALAAVVDAIEPRYVVGIGAFARDRAAAALAHRGVAIGTVLHPSPASPAANRGWATQAERQLRDLGLLS